MDRLDALFDCYLEALFKIGELAIVVARYEQKHGATVVPESIMNSITEMTERHKSILMQVGEESKLTSADLKDLN